MITNQSKIQFAVPSSRLDQIVDIIESSFTVGAATGGGGGPITTTSAIDTKPALLPGDLFYTKGLWSINGGATWQMLGGKIIVGYDSVVGTLTLSVSAYADAAGIEAQAFNQNTGSSYTILYRTIVMARYDQDGVPTKKLNSILRYSTKYNYMKIFLDNSVVLPNSGTTPIHHGLGYVPNVNVWLKINGSGFFQLQETANYSLDTQNLTLTDNSASYVATGFYRVYLDD